MRYSGELLIKTFRFFIAAALVLLGYNGLADLNQESEDFLYLSSIVKSAADDNVTQEEQLKALTQWLSVNVRKTSEFPGWQRSDYPDWFDGSSVASVIKGGVGNCGYQANNIITLSRYLGLRQHRRYWVGEQSGSEYEHAFAEVIIGGKPRVFDPNMLIYQENKVGEVLSLQEMVDNPEAVDNVHFRKIAAEIKDNPNVLRMTEVPKTPEPLGINSYAIYAAFGPTLTEMYLHLRANPLTVLVLSWFAYLIISAVFDIGFGTLRIRKANVLTSGQT